MKKILTLFILGLICVSCSSTYYVSSLSSTNPDMKQVKNGDFMMENDYAWIAYSFNGYNAPIRITVYNKSSEPLYVDWSKSAIAFADNSYAHEQSAVAVESFNIGKHEVFDKEGRPIENLKRDISLPNYISIIPSHTMVSHIPARISFIGLSNVPKKDYSKSMLTDKNNVPKKIELIDFSKDNTPLKFKSFVTTYHKGETPVQHQHEFYMGRLIKTSKLAPRDLNDEIAKRGDTFFLDKSYDDSQIYVTKGTSLLVGSQSMDVMVY